MSFFQRTNNKKATPPKPLVQPPVEWQVPTSQGPTVKRQSLEDWAHRLKNMANEAGDEDLLALESDLLDLRDEVVFELHQSLQ